MRVLQVLCGSLIVALAAGCSEGKAPACTSDACVSRVDGGKRREAGRDTLAPGDLSREEQARQPDSLRPEQTVVDIKPAHDGKLDAKLDLKADLKPTDSKPTDAKLDAKPGDGPPLTGCGAMLGKACTPTGGECGASAQCLLTTSAVGVCTCSCTPDNPQTPANEDTCPGQPQTFCRSVTLTSGLKQNFCFRSCSPKLGANECGAPIACDPRSASFAIKPGKAVCLMPGCAKDADCPVLMITACDTKTPSLTCAANEVCIPLAGGTTQGRCAKAGKCDVASGICTSHSLGSLTAKVGDPCRGDVECGPYMRCQIELDLAKFAKKGGAACADDDECCSGLCSAAKCAPGLCTVQFRNGHCTVQGCEFSATLPTRACPSGSICNKLYAGGLCQRSCSLGTASTCRGASGDLLGDYECRAWDNLAMGGVPVASGPVCDHGPSMPCNLLEASKLDCTSVADKSNIFVPNPTKMGCRSLGNIALTNPYDPYGFCLDDTSSGSQLRNPLPTP